MIHGPGVAIGFQYRAQPLQLRIVQRVPVENELGELALRLEAVAPQRFLDEAVDARHELLLGGPALREQLRKEALALHLPQAVIRMAHPGYEATWNRGGTGGASDGLRWQECRGGCGGGGGGGGGGVGAV